MTNKASVKLSKFPLNATAENLLTPEEFETLSPWEKGYATYMQSSWDESKLSEVNPFKIGTSEYKQFTRGEFAAMLEVQEIDS